MGRFAVVYADPPWSYNDKNPRGGAEGHYPTMTLARIKALPIARLAAPDAALFLWATWPLLGEALETMRAWGFEFKNAAFVWCKVNKIKPTPFVGLGHWTRGNTEPCLLGVRGDIRRLSAAVQQVVIDSNDNLVCAPIARHSEKPKEVRERIVELMGPVERIELFARQRFTGWEAWGNELP